jgi:hypothetical protein
VADVEADEAIQAVRACRSIGDAYRFLLDGFAEGDQWAIVDLRSLSVVRRGTTRLSLVGQGASDRT